MSESSTSVQITRRGFIGASLAAPLSVAGIQSAAGATSAPLKEADPGDTYLHTAQETARSIHNARIDHPDRAPWVP